VRVVAAGSGLPVRSSSRRRRRMKAAVAERRFLTGGFDIRVSGWR
jgi:hypothetical protein